MYQWASDYISILQLFFATVETIPACFLVIITFGLKKFQLILLSKFIIVLCEVGFLKLKTKISFSTNIYFHQYQRVVERKGKGLVAVF